jgi:single-strand DNA-binding protein
VNLVILTGRLGADPELKYTQGGQAVLNMRLATSEKYKDKSGEWKERTEWHSIVLWGKRAEALQRYLSKGSQLMIRGSLTTRSWDDKNGNKRYQTQVNATDVELFGGRGGQQQQPQSQPSESKEPAQSKESSFDDDDGPADDLPF